MNTGTAVNVTHFLLRAVAGLLDFQPGAQKTLAWFGGIPEAMGGQPKLMSQIGIGGAIELIGGALLILGLFTRPVAFILSGMMAVAYFQFHQPNGTWPVQNGGAPAVLMCFIFLLYFATGAGEWSLDNTLRKRRQRV